MDQSNISLREKSMSACFRSNRKTWWQLLRSACLALCISFTSLANAAEPTKISGTLPSGGQVSGAVNVTPQFPSGVTRVSFAATDNTNPAQLAIYSNLYGSTSPPTIISYPQPASLQLVDYKLSPNGQYVVQRLQNTSAGWSGLYVSSIFGAPPTPYILTAAVNREVLDYQISPDSTKVVYRLRQLGTGSTQLLSTPITVGFATTLAGALGGVAVTVQDDYKITADSLRVVFRENKVSPYPVTGIALASARLDGSSYTILEDFRSTATRTEVSDFALSPDSTYAVYRRGEGSPAIPQLFSIPVAGGTSVRLSFSGTSSTSDVASGFRISANAATVVFKATNTSTAAQDLYSVPIRAGATPVALVPGGGGFLGGQTITQFAISPDSSRVVSIHDKQFTNIYKLYSTPIGGGLAVAFQPNPNVDIASFAISPNSARVVFSSDTLYSAPLTGGSSTPLTNAATSGAGRYNISSDSSRVVFVGSNAALYSNRIIGGTATKLSGALVAGGFVGAYLPTNPPFVISPNSLRVIFSAVKETAGTFELYSSRIDGGGVFLDIDGDGKVLPHTDVLMLVRTLLDMPAPDVVAGATGTGATRFTNFTVPPYVAQVLAEDGGLALDIDGNGSVDLNTDLVLLMRYLIGMRDSNLTASALGVGATRNATQIATYVAQLLERPACAAFC
jgi:hypothetical protein